MKRFITALALAPLFYSAFSMADPKTLPQPETVYDACQEIVVFGGLLGKNDEKYHQNNMDFLKNVVLNSVKQWGFDTSLINSDAVLAAKSGYQVGQSSQRYNESPVSVNNQINDEMDVCLGSLGDSISEYQNTHQSILGN